MMNQTKAAIAASRGVPFTHTHASAIKNAFDAEATPELKALAQTFATLAETQISPLIIKQTVACLDYRTNTELVFLLEDLA